MMMIVTMKMAMRHRQDRHPGILCEVLDDDDDSDDENGNETQTGQPPRDTV